ncbi:MAG: prepilin-type N-terminal cleavage/methylation domain-containing protein [Proteobacteria bacterium]|nr:prepilin-type N-terminal cleavage/methylation domain-containing protein [Pseudomonadota bacterium]
MSFAGSCARRDGGFTLVSVMVASALLAVVFFTSLPALVFVLRASHGNNLRTVANFTAEQTLEELRAIGKEELLTRLVLDNSGTPIWVYDAVADTAEPITDIVVLRTGYIIDGQNIEEDHTEDITMTQEVKVYAADDNGSPDTSWLTLAVDFQWEMGNRVYSDSLMTIVE